MFNQVQYVTVDAEQQGQRLDNYLLRILKGVPKSHIYRIVRKGEVRVNKKRIKPDYRVQAGDELRIPPIRLSNTQDKSKPSQGLMDLIQAAIVKETHELLILNKPAGVPVHGGVGVANGIIEILRYIRPDTYLELVHRLDKDTSGCLLIAKNAQTLRYLHGLLRDGQVTKGYMTLVHGHWQDDLSTISSTLKKQQKQSGERMVVENEQGKQSVTHFNVVKRFAQHTLLEVYIDTGRTHQIRVHAANAGHPIVFDDKYGDRGLDKLIHIKKGKRLFLHAYKLSLKLENEQKTMDICLDLPQELNNLLDLL